jgi:CBS domain containing-hemolysin-like protein
MGSTSISLIVVVLLLVANAFFVAAEFALVKARGFRVNALAESGNRSARLTQQIMLNLEAYLAACQLGITMASLGLGWVGEPAVAALLEPVFEAAGLPPTMLHTASFLIGFLIFSSLHIVVGEQVPKTLAIRKPEPVSLLCAYPLRAFYLFAFPLNWLLNRASGAILARFGVAEATHMEVLSDAEIKGAIEVSRDHGDLSTSKADMLKNMFDFDQRTVQEIMISRNQVHTLDLSSDAETNSAIMRDTGHSRFPLVDGDSDEPVGFILARDIYAAVLAGEREPWSDLRRFCREPQVVPESQRIALVFETMRRERAHMVLVVDEYGSFSGIASLEDLLEEIVGEIEDELDTDEPGAGISEHAGSWESSGLTALSDIERSIGLVAPAEANSNTLSGLAMHCLGRMPVKDDSFEVNGYRVIIKSVSERRVDRARIEKLVPVDNTFAGDNAD